jgi:signal transduction histidine kinase
MERPRWTDERLDERFHSLDRTLDRLDQDMRELRSDMKSGFAEVRREINSLRQVTYRMFGGLLVGLAVNSLLQGAL